MCVCVSVIVSMCMCAYGCVCVCVCVHIFFVCAYCVFVCTVFKWIFVYISTLLNVGLRLLCFGKLQIENSSYSVSSIFRSPHSGLIYIPQGAAHLIQYLLE